MFSFFKKKKPVFKTFEEQLAILATCGVTLDQNVQPTALLDSFDIKTFEEAPFVLMMTTMGTEAETQAQIGKNGYPSDNIWLLDSECIEDDGDYCSIVSRLSVLAGSCDKLGNMNDEVDISENTAWVSFDFDGKSYKFDAQVNEDWLDLEVLSQLAKAFTSENSSRRFTYIDLGTQDFLITFSTKVERGVLTKATGLKIRWLG